jgi:hypothetical protein
MAAGYVGEKDLVLAESPYDGFMQKFVELIHNGKADDYYRLFVMEAVAHGITMSYPYGSWMGNKARDAFYPPRTVSFEVQDFLAENDVYFGKKSGANVLVLYDYRSNLFRDWQCGQGETLTVGNADDLLSYGVAYDERAECVPYLEIGKGLINSCMPYDVYVLGDGVLVPDDFDIHKLDGYDLVVTADCGFLTSKQADTLQTFAANKLKSFYIYGDYGKNLPGELEAVTWIGATSYKGAIREFCHAVNEGYAPYRMLDWDNGNMYVQQITLAKARVLHLLNYAFDTGIYKTIPQSVNLTLKDGTSKRIRGLTLDGSPLAINRIPQADGSLVLAISRLPCYAMVVIE